MPDGLAPYGAARLRGGGRIMVTDDPEYADGACLECGGPTSERRIKFDRKATATEAGFKLDLDVPYCPVCRLTIVPKGLTAAAKAAAEWKGGRR